MTFLLTYKKLYLHNEIHKHLEKLVVIKNYQNLLLFVADLQ